MTALDVYLEAADGLRRAGRGDLLLLAASKTISFAEVDEIATRLTSGPYKTQGDVQTNSPGDGARVLSQSSTFLANKDTTPGPGAPKYGGWHGPTWSLPGAVSPSGNTDLTQVPPREPVDEMRDAAFVALCQGNLTMAQAARDVIVWQVTSATDTNFTDSARWKTDPNPCRTKDDPSFTMAAWAMKHMYCYDYLRLAEQKHGWTLFTAAQNTTLATQWTAFGYWLKATLDTEYNELFVDRPNGNYTSESNFFWEMTYSRALYDGGPTPRKGTLRYENKGANNISSMGLIGVIFEDAALVTSFKTNVEDWLAYSVYGRAGAGFTGRQSEHGGGSDFHRGTLDVTDSDRGIKYTLGALGLFSMVMEPLARQGDTILFDLVTTRGEDGTGGFAKSIMSAAQDCMRFIDHTIIVRVPGKPGTDGIIDLRDDIGDPERINDNDLLPLARFYRFRRADDSLYLNVTRQKAGRENYPVSPRQSQGNPASGPWGVHPGMHLQYAMDTIDPYGAV